MKKKILIVVLILSLVIAGTSAALAVEPDEAEQTAEQITRTIEDLFGEYNPSQQQKFLDLKAEHQAFHESRQALKDDTIRGYAAQVAVIAGQVADGSIEPSEGRDQFSALKAEYQGTKDAIAPIQEQKQAEAETLKSEMETLRAGLKEALKQDEVDASAVAGYLNSFINLLEKHIEMDYKYAAMVDDILE